ncbi:uncharacterized protein N7525_011219 [Penicillium rubens]|uniref:uncharacterized protein n=1 Tax=Penicillium rubens TaxID=1108849 RepID=UPI002A5ABDB6|nr:uncharacterized protein N7525_011219 [Penicillium rubens]KAJ5821935.1 hypothetical protein N7525_011219 [Penicillium rubens]KAJ5859576.1 hypothetical protein N7534_004853 [Penicillium rubens]
MGTMGGVTSEDVVILMLLIALTTLWALIVIFCVEWWRLLRTLNPPGSDPRVPVTTESYNKGRRHKMPQLTGRNPPTFSPGLKRLCVTALPTPRVYIIIYFNFSLLCRSQRV